LTAVNELPAAPVDGGPAANRAPGAPDNRKPRLFLLPAAYLCVKFLVCKTLQRSVDATFVREFDAI
jgi:hypothetical protein